MNSNTKQVVTVDSKIEKSLDNHVRSYDIPIFRYPYEGYKGHNYNIDYKNIEREDAEYIAKLTGKSKKEVILLIEEANSLPEKDDEYSVKTIDIINEEIEKHNIQ
jgi:hypothetical protein